MICLPATVIARAAQADYGYRCRSASVCGAFSGNVSAEMLKGAGAVIVGHLERRQYHAGTEVFVAAEAKATGRAGFLAIRLTDKSEHEKRSPMPNDQAKLQGFMDEASIRNAIARIAEGTTSSDYEMFRTEWADDGEFVIGKA